MKIISYKKLLSGFLFLAAVTSVCKLQAQIAPDIEWQKCLGGIDHEEGHSIQQTTDGGFMVAGYTFSNNGDVTVNHGGADYWMVKLDTNGNLVWQKTLGGTLHDFAYSVLETTDGGFALAGISASNDDDVSGNHGLGDCWIVKLDVAANITWQKSLGGSDNDDAWDVQQTVDGGFILASGSWSDDDDVSGNHGYFDYWIVKLNSAGNIDWQNCLGGSDIEEAISIQQTTDQGFIIAGRTESNDGDVSGNNGDSDFWIVKLDTLGNLTWQKAFGGSVYDAGISVQQTADGGFIAIGTSASNDGDVSGNHGGLDYWVIKMDTSGNLEWQKSFGGSSDEVACSIQQTLDGNFIVVGWSSSSDGDVTGNHGNKDSWIIKIDTTGNIIWEKSFGGSDNDQTYNFQLTTDGGFVVAGLSNSNDGDVSGNHGEYDYWVIKLSPDIPTAIPSAPTNSISLYPNPVQTHLSLNLTTPSVEARIRVYDLRGKMIALPTTFTNTEAQLNTTSLADGFYTLQITNNKTGASEVGKFVKQQ